MHFHPSGASSSARLLSFCVFFNLVHKIPRVVVEILWQSTALALRRLFRTRLCLAVARFLTGGGVLYSISSGLRLGATFALGFGFEFEFESGSVWVRFSFWFFFFVDCIFAYS